MKKNSKKGKKDKKVYSTPDDSVEMTPELISTVTQLQSFIKKLPRCHTISSRLTATKNLLDIKNNELYQKCIELKGLSILSKWLKEYKVSVADGTDLTRDEEIIVTNIICLGDSLFEMEAGRILASRFTEAFIKTIKFRETPKLDELIKQLKLVCKQFNSIYSSIKNLTIRVERKKK